MALPLDTALPKCTLEVCGINGVEEHECVGRGSWTEHGCECDKGLAGPRCTYSDLVTCSNHGAAMANGSCFCKIGYVGEACDTNIVPQLVFSENVRNGKLETSEDGSSDSYTVKLSFAPNAPLTVHLRSAPASPQQVLLASRTGNSFAIVSPSAEIDLVFDSANWDMERTITVNAINDAWVEGPHSVRLVHKVAYPALAGYDSDYFVPVNIADNDEARIEITSPESIGIGRSATVQMKLTAPPLPGSSVTILPVADQPRILEIGSAGFTFDASTYNIPVEFPVLVPLTKDPCGLMDARINYRVSSTLPVFNQLQPPPTQVVIEDLSEARVVVTPNEGVILADSLATILDEGFFQISLSKPPCVPIKVRYGLKEAVAAKQVRFVPSYVTIDRGNWNKLQRIRVLAYNDGVVQGDIFSELTVATAKPGPFAYVPAADPLLVKVVERDEAGVRLSAPSVIVCPENCVNGYNVTLRTRPAGKVTVTLAVEATPAKLHFSAETFATPQRVALGAPTCPLTEDTGKCVFTVSHQVESEEDVFYNLAGELAVAEVTVAGSDQERRRRSMMPVQRRELQSTPVLTLQTTPLQYTEGYSPIAIDSLATVSADNNIVQASASITPWERDTDFLTWDEAVGGTLGTSDGLIDANLGNQAYGSISLSGVATAEEYTVRLLASWHSSFLAASPPEKALRGFFFQSTGPIIDHTEKTVTMDVMDQYGTSSSRVTRIINITLTNQAPSAQATILTGSSGVDENVGFRDTRVGSYLRGIDPEDEGSLEYEIKCEPGKGRVEMTSIDSRTGYMQFFYYPKLNEVGMDQFIWAVTDIHGSESAFQLLEIEINPGNSFPLAYDSTLDAISGIDNTAYMASGDPDNVDGLDDVEFYIITSCPSYGTVTLTDSSGSCENGNLKGRNPYVYTPDENGLGSEDSFTFSVEDYGGYGSVNCNCDDTVGTIANTPPIANDQVFSVNASGSVTAVLDATDSVGDITFMKGYYLASEVDGRVVANTITEQRGLGDKGSVKLIKDDGGYRTGGFIYTADVGEDSGMDYFTWVVIDRAGNMSNMARVTINVLKDPVPAIPACSPTSYLSNLTQDSITGDASALNYYLDQTRHHVQVEQLGDAYAYPVDVLSAAHNVGFITSEGVTLMCEQVDHARMLMSTGDAFDGGTVALLAWDIDNVKSVKQTYSFKSLPASGTLYYNGTFEGAAMVSSVSAATELGASDTFLLNPGQPLYLMYIPPPYLRGAPHASFEWTVTDADGAEMEPATANLHVQCQPAYKQSADGLSCEPCPEGEFNNPGVPDQAVCYPCEAGTFSSGATTQCASCPENTYQAEEGATSCTSCPDPNQESKTGSTKKVDCRCPPTTWRKDDDTCVVHPETGDLLNCLPDNACYITDDTSDVKNGKCQPGYEGTACNRCKEGYFRNVAECEKCSDEDWLPWVLMPFAYLFGTVCLFWFCQLDRLYGAFHIILCYLQIFSVYRFMKLDWPPALKALMEFFGLLNLDNWAFAPECALQAGYPNKLPMMNMNPVVFLTILSGYGLFQRIRDQGMDPVFVRNLASAFLLYLNWGYLSMAIYTFQYFNCILNNHEWVMWSDPSTICFDWSMDSEYTKIFPLAVIDIVVYPVCTFLFFARITFNHREDIMSRDIILANVKEAAITNKEDVKTMTEFMDVYGFLYRRLETDCYYFDLVRLLGKFLISLTLLIRNAQQQMLICVFVLIGLLVSVTNAIFTFMLIGACGFLYMDLQKPYDFLDEDEKANDGLVMSSASSRSRGRMSTFSRASKMGNMKSVKSFRNTLSGPGALEEMTANMSRREKIMVQGKVLFTKEFLGDMQVHVACCAETELAPVEAAMDHLIQLHWETWQEEKEALADGKLEMSRASMFSDALSLDEPYMAPTMCWLLTASKKVAPADNPVAQHISAHSNKFMSGVLKPAIWLPVLNGVIQSHRINEMYKWLAFSCSPAHKESFWNWLDFMAVEEEKEEEPATVMQRAKKRASIAFSPMLGEDHQEGAGAAEE
eukprot:gene2448-3182_t